VCSGGSCQLTCQQQLTACQNGDAGLVCTDTNSDINNCGSCGVACQQGYFCVQGYCQIVCPQGYGQCGQQCFDFQNDSLHCGSCYTQCFGNQVCTQGICCNQGLVNCNSQCTNTNDDANNCGACGTKCSGGTPYCVNGACKQCPLNANYVNGKCVEVYNIDQSLLDSTPNNCGTYWYNCGTWGFHWNDNSSSAPSAVSVQMLGGLECSAGTRTVSLNGTAVATYNATGTCSCVATPTQFNFNLSPLGSYAVGQKNAISINAPSCEGLTPNNNWGGNYAQVTVTY
jgi:hypothetical protein